MFLCQNLRDTPNIALQTDAERFSASGGLHTIRFLKKYCNGTVGFLRCLKLEALHSSLALALSSYSFLVGFVALLGSRTPPRRRLGETPSPIAASSFSFSPPPFLSSPPPPSLSPPPTARRAGIVTFAAVLLAGMVLVVSAFNDDFSIAYIFHHSNHDLLPPINSPCCGRGRKARCCSGRCSWPATDSFCVCATRPISGFRLCIGGDRGGAGFLLLILNFSAHPFAIMQGAIPADGTGLNPLLQYPEMVIHPPMLYLGYVGFTVPFAFALGALIMKYPGEKWIQITRRWTMVTWCFLTVGIFLGAHWAYAVLGWGGYWGWDPVENASLMPWLTGTAFLHSVMMQEKRGMLKVWNMALIFSTFLLCMLGTFLTRSGVISSVHALRSLRSAHGSWYLFC